MMATISDTGRGYPEKLKELLEEINKDILVLHQYSTDDFMPVNQIFKNYFDKSKRANSEKKEGVDEGDYKLIIGKIITDLQFHDIIRQKMEHIESINNLIMNEFDQRKADPSCVVAVLGLLGDIASVHEGQLTFLHEEYQETIIKLRINLEHMENYIAKVASVSLNLSNSFTQSAEFNKLYKAIVGKLKTIASYARQEDLPHADVKKATIDKLRTIYTMQSERKIFDKIFLINEDVAAGASANAEDDIEFF